MDYKEKTIRQRKRDEQNEVVADAIIVILVAMFIFSIVT